MLAGASDLQNSEDVTVTDKSKVNTETNSRPIEFLIPKEEDLNTFAHKACRALGHEFHDFQVEVGIASLLELAASVAVDQATRQRRELSEAA
ncbi:MAG: hypothetical protein Kow0077_22780 [Anaerolineae bacterium]